MYTIYSLASSLIARFNSFLKEVHHDQKFPRAFHGAPFVGLRRSFFRWRLCPRFAWRWLHSRRQRSGGCCPSTTRVRSATATGHHPAGWSGDCSTTTVPRYQRSSDLSERMDQGKWRPWSLAVSGRFAAPATRGHLPAVQPTATGSAVPAE